MQTQEKTHTFKSPLKWAGGKSALIPVIQAIWESQLAKNPSLIWVELFAGGLSLPLGIQPKVAIINDYNVHLMDFWRWVRDDGEIENDLYDKFSNTPECYYKNREAFNYMATPELFYYLNRTGFNGLCRYSKKGKYNVPFGKYKEVNYRNDFSEYQSLLKSWLLINGDFRNITLQPDYFVFADPPYDSESNSAFTGYSSNSFIWEDQVDLAKRLASHRGVSIATNKATDRILDLYGSLGFDISLRLMRRRIAANGNRKPVMEMFATKNLK